MNGNTYLVRADALTSPEAANSDRPAAQRPAPDSVATIIYFSGPLRGKTERLELNAYRLMRSDARLVAAESNAEDYFATLHRADDSYEIVAHSEQRLFVNGEAREHAILNSADLVELEGGPVLRFRSYPPNHQPSKSLRDIFTDCVDCARLDERPWWRVLPSMMVEAVREIATQTSRWFRVLIVAAIVFIVLALLLSAWRSDELGSQLVLEKQRIDALELSKAAATGVIARASPSIVFIQGAFGFEEPASGRRLRYIAGPGGGPMRLPDGSPAFTLDERGELFEVEYTGTAFIVGADGLLMTNRHVALPWEVGQASLLNAVGDQALRGLVVRMQGFVPASKEPFKVTLLRASDNADLALLRGSGAILERPPLPLAETAPSPGEQVILLGYPTGMRALLARAPPAFREKFSGPGHTADTMADELAAANLIRPLASRGIVGQISDSVIVYDAQTTSGGSGGPLLNESGEVTAINMAILPEFGGSNLGVPAGHARQLLAEHRQQR